MTSSKAKVWTLRAVKWFGVLVAIGALGLIGVESWRQYRIGSAIDDLTAAQEQAMKYIFNGNSKQEYLASFSSDDNGWDQFTEVMKLFDKTNDELKNTKHVDTDGNEIDWLTPSLH